jgi:hypothetical protein
MPSAFMRRPAFQDRVCSLSAPPLPPRLRMRWLEDEEAQAQAAQGLREMHFHELRG